MMPEVDHAGAVEPWRNGADALMSERIDRMKFLAFLIGALLGLVGGAALLAYAYQAAGLYPPDDATIKFIARERGWLKEEL